MNSYAYYALKCEQGGYAYTRAIDGISFCGGNELTFSCDFYYDKGYSGPLFSQTGSVLGEIKNGYISWSLNNGTVLKSDSSTFPLWEEDWNHLDVVYSKDKLIMYINRVPAGEKSIGQVQPASGENLVIGEDYPGYIRNVRIADFAFTQEDILNNCVQTKVEQDKLLLYIPFDEFDVKDKGKHALPVVCYGLARAITLAGALSFSGSGFAAVHGRELNPGTAEMPEFTIALRVFLYPTQQENCVLYENVQGNGDGFALKLSQTSDSAFLNLEAGDFSYSEKAITLSYFQWQDLCVTVKDKQVSVYINGELIKNLVMPQAYVRMSSAQIYMGDHKKGGKSINGAIDYFAVYSACLPPEQISEISKVEPYLFDFQIAGLYLFHGEGLEDMVGSGSLSLSGCGLKLLEGTVFETQIEPFTFRASDEFPGSDFDLWEADTLIDLYLPIIAGMNGTILPEKIPGSIKWLFLQETASIQAIQNIYSNYDDIQESLMDDMIEQLKKSASARTLAVSASIAGIGASAYSFYSMSQLMEKYEEAWAVLLVPFVAYFVKKIVDDWKKKKPKEPPVPNPPIPQFGYTVTLESVQFCLEDQGSLPLRENFTTPQTLPEWSAKTSDAAKMAYIAKSQKPMIKIGFHYKPAPDQFSSQVTLYGSGGVFGSFQSEPVFCKLEGDYTATAQLTNFKVGEDTASGCYEDEIKWSYNSYLGIQTFMRVTKQQTHVIRAEPRYPWSLTDPEHYPTIELLEMNKKIFGNEKVKDEPAFIKAVYKYLRDTVKPQYAPREKYTARTEHSVTDVDMDNKKLFEAIKRKGAELGALDVCAMTQYLAAMEGWQPRIMGFFGMEYMDYSNAESAIVSLGFKMKDMEAWGAEVTSDTPRHYAMALSQGEGLESMVISDITWNPKGSDEYLGDMPLANYLEKTAANTDYFGPRFIGCRVREQDAAASERSVNIKYDYTSHSFVPTDRTAFANHIKKKFHFTNNQACCHRVSYKYMENLLISIFNKMKNGKISKRSKDDALINMYYSFYEDGAVPPDEFDQKNAEELKETLLSLSDVEPASLQDDLVCITTGMRLKLALNCFNNAEINLRVGNFNWNCSVGKGFDPEEYEIVFMLGDKLKAVNHEGVISDVTELKLPGIYLKSEDKRIWTRMSKAAKLVGENPPTISCSERFEQTLGVYIPFAYSSNNSFLIPDSIHSPGTRYEVIDSDG